MWTKYPHITDPGLLFKLNNLFVHYSGGGLIITCFHLISDKVVCMCTIFVPGVCAMVNTVLTIKW